MHVLTPTVAVIGSGPAGCYSAQFIKKNLPDAEVTVFEALPTPYGLLRYGVAADHQGTKSVSAQFERMFTRGGVEFVGNVEIGRDLTLDELSAAFDVVVLATGMNVDRKLGIPGDDLHSIVGAGELLRALNGHPNPGGAGKSCVVRPLGERVAVIGHGNVAMDVIRLIAKKDEELVGSDINDVARHEFQVSDVRRIDVIGRSSIEQAKFDIAMLREICQLNNTSVRWSAKPQKCNSPAAELLMSKSAMLEHAGAPVEINFHFGLSPLLISTRNQSLVLTLKDVEDDVIQDVICDSVITAVGFCQGPKDLVCSSTGTYPVGWARRGPVGTVAANRRDALDVTAQILGDLKNGQIITGKPGLNAVLQRIAHKAVTFQQWKQLDAHEIHSADPGRCRRKITSITEMLAVMEIPVPVPE